MPNWKTSLRILLLFFIAILLAFTFSHHIGGATKGEHTGLILETASSSPESVKPGDSVYLSFNLTNTGDSPDRFLLVVDSQYSWQARITSVVDQSGGSLNFTQNTNGFMIVEPIQSEKSALITIAVSVPALGTSPEFTDMNYLESIGLVAGTTYRLSLTAKAESDNFATGDEAQYSMTVEDIHSIGLRCSHDIIIDPYGERTAVVEVNVTHLSNSNMEELDSIDIQLSLLSPSPDWDVRLSEYRFSLLPRISRTVLLTVTLPENVFSFDPPYHKDITIMGNDSIYGNLASERVRVWLKQRGSVSVELVDEEEKYVVPGETVIFNFTLTNTGNGPDSFSLKGGCEKAGWVTLPLEETQVIAPSETVMVSINVSVPIKDLPPMGTVVRVSLSAISMATPEFFDSANARVVVGKLSGLGIVGEKIADIFPPSTANITVTVENTGNYIENMELMIEPIVNLNGKNTSLTDTRWGVTIYPTSLTLNPGEKETVRVEISAGGSYIQGDVLVFYIDGLIDGNVMGRTFLGAKVGLTHGVKIECNVTEKSGKLGEEIYYFFNVTNTGSARDVFYLEHTIAPGWYSFLGVTQISLLPHQSAFVDAMVKIPLNASVGESCVFTLIAENNHTRASLSVVTSVSPTRSLQLLSSNLTHHVFPGESIRVEVIVINIGNVEDTVSLISYTTSQWSSTIIPNKLNIPAFSTFYVNLTIHAPVVITQEDKAEFSVTAFSVHSKKVNATITVRAELSMAEPIASEDYPYYIVEHPDYTAGVHGYTVRGRAVEYGFRVKNIDTTEQLITFQHSPTVLQISCDRTNLTLKPGEEVLLHLIISATHTTDIGDYSMNFYFTSASGRHEEFLVITTVIGVDLKVGKIESDHLLEGKRSNLKVEILLLGFGYEGIPDPSLLSFSNIVVETEYGDEYHTTIIPHLNIGESAILRFDIKPDLLRWYEKKDKIVVRVFITHYESLLRADDDPDNNRKETTLTVYDAPPSGIVTTSIYTGIFTSIVLLVLVLHYLGRVEGHFRKRLPGDPRIYPWRGLFLGLITGLIFTFPMSNSQSSALLSVILFLCISLSVYLSLQARLPHIGGMVPLLFFMGAVVISTIGTGVSGAIKAFFLSGTDITPAHYLFGVGAGIGAYLLLQYKDAEFGELQVEWLQLVIGTGIALILGIYYILSPSPIPTLIALVAVGVFLFYLINSIPILKNITLVSGLYTITLILYTSIFLIIATGGSEEAIVYLFTPVNINNFLFTISLLILSALLSYIIYRLHIVIGQEIENIHAVFRRVSGEKDIEKALSSILISSEAINRRDFR